MENGPANIKSTTRPAQLVISCLGNKIKLPLYLNPLFLGVLPQLGRIDQSMARRPTNLMIALSALDAAKDVLRGASDKRNDTKRAKGRAAAVSTAATTARSGPQEQVAMDRGKGEQEERSGKADTREVEEVVPRRGLLNCPRTEAGTRDTPGWRAWEAR